MQRAPLATTALATVLAANDDLPQIERLREHREQALAEVILASERRLLRIIDLRLDPRLAGRVDAADVLQEAFLEAQKRLPRFLEHTAVPVFVWIRGVVLDAIVHVHRRHLGAQMRDATRDMSLQQVGSPQLSSRSLTSRLAANLTSPSQAAIRKELTQGVEETLTAMDEIDKEVLVLRHFEQLSNDEVASVIGVKKAAASRRYMRALARFREAMSDVSDFEGN